MRVFQKTDAVRTKSCIDDLMNLLFNHVFRVSDQLQTGRDLVFMSSRKRASSFSLSPTIGRVMPNTSPFIALISRSKAPSIRRPSPRDS